MGKIFLCCLFFCTQNALCQSDLYPETYNLFFQNLPFINPAVVNTLEKITLNSQIKFRTGAFKKIATYSFIGEFSKSWENKNAHSGRVLFFNEKDGPYINRPRVYGNYAYQLPLAAGISLSAGVSLGMGGLYFSAPSPTAYGSASVIDGNAGMVVKTNALHLGFASMQLLNSQSAPINSNIRYRRFYTIYSAYEKSLNKDFTLKGYGLCRIFTLKSEDFLAGFLVDYKESFGVGSLIYWNQGLSFFLNVKANSNATDTLFLSFGYNTPLLAGKALSANAFEITLKYMVN